MNTAAFNRNRSTKLKLLPVLSPDLTVRASDPSVRRSLTRFDYYSRCSVIALGNRGWARPFRFIVIAAELHKGLDLWWRNIKVSAGREVVQAASSSPDGCTMQSCCQSPHKTKKCAIQIASHQRHSRLGSAEPPRTTTTTTGCLYHTPSSILELRYS